MQHDMEGMQAFGKVDSGPPKSRNSDREGEKTKKDGAGGSHVDASSSKDGAKKDPKEKNYLPTPC